MIKQTQDQWLQSNYVASSEEGGLSFPDFKKISDAFKLNYMELSEESDIDEILQKFITSKLIFKRIFQKDCVFSLRTC